MKKKFKTFIILCILALFSTGCVKYNAKMDIKRDKSINYEIIYAMQSSLTDGQQVMDEEGVKELKDNGFTVKEYNEDGYVGFKISKKIKNIDNISDTNEVTYSLSDDTSKKDNKIFTVKKGLFKNTYKAKFSFDMNNSGLNSDSDEDDESNVDMSQYLSSMDLKYTVNLPYKAKSNNATTVNKGGKQLVWDLATANSIEYEFELYNPIFYIAIGVGIVIVIGIIIIVIKKNKGSKKSTIETNSTQIVDNIPTTDENKQVVDNTIDNQVTNNIDTDNQVINNIPTMDTNTQVINNTPSADNTIDNQAIDNSTNVDNNNLM